MLSSELISRKPGLSNLYVSHFTSDDKYWVCRNADSGSERLYGPFDTEAEANLSLELHEAPHG